MHHAAHISAYMVLLVAIASSDPQEAVTIHITGPVRLIIGTPADNTTQEGHGTPADNTTQEGHELRHGEPTADKCTGADGICVETGDRCNGTIYILHNSCNDHCSCCLPDPVCPRWSHGTFTLPESTQCFKAHTEEWYYGTTAEAKCKEEGMALAKPDGNPAALQKHLHETYGYNMGYCIGGRGDGSSFRWLRGGEIVDLDTPWWYPGEPNSNTEDGELSTDHCMGVLADDTSMNLAPGQPYHSQHCSWPCYPLCEVVVE